MGIREPSGADTFPSLLHNETIFGGAAKAEVEPPLRRKPRFPRRRLFESGTSAFADYFVLPFLTNKNLQNVPILETPLLTSIAVVHV